MTGGAERNGRKRADGDVCASCSRLMVAAAHTNRVETCHVYRTSSNKSQIAYTV